MDKITWEFLQEGSDKILSDGLYKLQQAPYVKYADVSDSASGNYLISHEGKCYYIGEAQNICKRLNQQFQKNSTFYKNYKKTAANKLTIDSFNVQLISTVIGRKEIEEFGIVNLSTSLNKFQLGKRAAHEVACQQGLWENVQNEKDALLKQAEEEVLNVASSLWFKSAAPNAAGLYIVRNIHEEIIYIGESSLLLKRYKAHSSRTYFSALRRHIGTELLGYQLQIREINVKKRDRWFSEHEDLQVTEFLKECSIAFYPTRLGRYELEEYLIKKHRPLLNRKGKA